MIYATTTIVFVLLALALAVVLAMSASPMGEVGPVREPAPVEPAERDPGPRKAIVGTSIFSIFGEFTTLEDRLEELGALVDEMAADARERHGRGPDIVALTEVSINAGRKGSLVERAVPLEGAVQDYFAAKAREHETHIVVCFNMLEDAEREIVSNSAVIFDRRGEVAGIYRKVFLTARPGQELPEGGKWHGTRWPVFDLDFGRVGVQICYDMGFADGVDALAAQGAELIIWPSASPQTMVPSMWARQHELYIVSATPRDNASVFDPLGQVVAQVEPPGQVVTHELDLDFRIVHWQPGLDEGRPLVERFGERIGFRYSTREDYGIFWSNDASKPIGAMLEEAEIVTDAAQRRRTRVLRERLVGERGPVGEPAG